MAKQKQDGFTLIEILVVMFLLSIITTAFFQVLLSATEGSSTAGDIARVSEQARLGFNRMVRDTREADRVTNLSPTSFKVEIDFDGDGVIQPVPSAGGELGSYETLTFSFVSGTISVTSGSTTEVLVSGVSCVRRNDGTCEDVFTYSSSRLEYDNNPTDGVASAAELNQLPPAGVGENNLANWTSTEMSLVDRVTFALKVTEGTSSTDFHADAQLRNRR